MTIPEAEIPLPVTLMRRFWRGLLNYTVRRDSCTIFYRLIVIAALSWIGHSLEYVSLKAYETFQLVDGLPEVHRGFAEANRKARADIDMALSQMVYLKARNETLETMFRYLQSQVNALHRADAPDAYRGPPTLPALPKSPLPKPQRDR